jgi:transposase
MKKNSTEKLGGKAVSKEAQRRLQALVAARRRGETVEANLTIGLDMGDRGSSYCVLDEAGEVMERGQAAMDRQALATVFGQFPASTVVLEVGGHSPWVSRLLTELGHEGVVANSRAVELITRNSRKNDRMDAELLARLGRADRKLLKPVQHRGEQAQADLMGVRVRAHLVEQRTSTINAVRGLVKNTGRRLPVCDADTLGPRHAAGLPEGVRKHVERLLGLVEELTEEIAACDKELAELSRTRYAAETQQLQQVAGVGPVTALTFVLTLDDPHRFDRSRDVGAYLGLVPKSSQAVTATRKCGSARKATCT